MSDRVDTLTDHMGALQRQTRQRGQPLRHQRMRERFLEASDAPEATRQRSAWGWPAMGVVAVVAVVLAVVWTLRPQPLTFEVGPTARTDSAAFFSASDDEALELSFSDGSTVELRPRARMRVANLESDSAGLVLESGALDLRLRPSASPWSIEAGPFRVSTEGATLMVRWAPDVHAFALELREGRAMVQGPGIDGAREATAGQRVVLGNSEATQAATHRADQRVPENPATPAKAQPAAPSAEAVAPDPAPTSPRRGRTRGSSRAPAKASADWRALAQSGEHTQALAAAEAVGFSKLCDSLRASALLELADAARYARRKTRAREALQSIRRRFPGTDAAATAAFDLGRLAARCTGAPRWFRTYLDERPAGSMAEAAQQRLAECTASAGEEPGAKP